MIDRQKLLTDLQDVLETLEADLLERSESDEVPAVGEKLRAEYERAKSAQRTAQNYEDWRSDAITQAAAAWVLSCVFARFLEDNGLVAPPKIAGPPASPQGDQLQRARDEHELYFSKHPRETDRDYLLSVFDELAKLPGTKDVFGEHNPFRELPNWLSGDAAGELLRFFRKIDANTGALVHDFTDPTWDTRFLGDLYQDLSEAARKKYALLQTPEFVEEFILDRTLDPALDEFGLDAAQVKDQDGKPITEPGFRMIDPACGSGHFLLGAFPRLLARWQKKEPGTNVRALVQRALDSIHGVDVNPYAVAIARFRLLLAAMQACGIRRLADAPAFKLNLACGDSLLHGLPSGDQLTLGWRDIDHHYHVEDYPLLRHVLRPCTYHVVVANPPYIQVKDKARNRAYRERYPTAAGKFSLASPFMERLFSLAATSGFVGQITANSFMKRKFGKKLIERYLPRVDLQVVIDTAFAEIPGHSTPTVILFGRNRRPVSSTVRCVMGIRGEANTPSKAAAGAVWCDIVSLVDQVGSHTSYISVADVQRTTLSSHPWSIGGGGAAELKELLDDNADHTLADFSSAVGITAVPGEDAVFLLENDVGPRFGIELTRPIVVGDAIRDWRIHDDIPALWVYDEEFRLLPLESLPRIAHWLWPYRAVISKRKRFGTSMVDLGYAWYEWQEIYADKLQAPRKIALALIASHNHFALDATNRLFKNSVYVITLKPSCDTDTWLYTLGLLNSSTGCFWLKQVCFPKGTATGDISSEKGKPEANRYDFGSKSLLDFPIPALGGSDFGQVVRITADIVESASRLSQCEPLTVIYRAFASGDPSELSSALNSAEKEYHDLQSRLKELQRELDIATYRCYQLTSAKADSSDVLRQSGDADNVAPSSDISLIESPSYKRQWFGRQGVYGSASSTFEDKRRDAIKLVLMRRLESLCDVDARLGLLQPTRARGNHTPAMLGTALISVARLADCARSDLLFMHAAEVYRDDPAFDVQVLVAELVESESIPFLPVLRYKQSGLRKRAQWEEHWQSLRLSMTEEAAVDLITPPKYVTGDFERGEFWRLRGKLDVPKERWVSFPNCEGPDGTLMIAWAGYDHLQLARAISAYFVDVKERLGGADDPRLVPLLACLIELLPWLKQWHNDIDPEFNVPMGDYFEGFVTEEARALGKTIPEIKAWTPPARTARRGRRGRTQTRQTSSETDEE
jgi:hypothetical protein